MSELKAINAYQLTLDTEESEVYIHNDEFGCGGVLVECYLKSEADKVIAWHKYKRCLAMVRWCKLKRIDAADYRIPRDKWEFYEKWHNRWLKLAEKFKEAK